MSVAPNKYKIGLIKIRNTAVSTMLTAVIRVTALPAPFFAAAASPSPGFRL